MDAAGNSYAGMTPDEIADMRANLVTRQVEAIRRMRADGTRRTHHEYKSSSRSDGGKKRSCKKRGGKKRSCKKRGGKKRSCKKRN
jgi:hypothetical protein